MKSKTLSAKLHFAILLVALAFTSCKKEGNTEKTTSGFSKISYVAKAIGSGIKTSSSKSGSILNSVEVEWSSASVYVEKISFIGKKNSLIDTTIIVEKNLNIYGKDALAGIIQLPAGSYKDVKVKMFLKKSQKSEMAFDLKGIFTNTQGGQDSVMVGSSFPFEANLTVTDMLIDPLYKYKATFKFDLNKALSGISAEMLQTAKFYTGKDNKKKYIIWKGGSIDEPFYNQVIENWQSIASIVIEKESNL